MNSHKSGILHCCTIRKTTAPDVDRWCGDDVEELAGKDVFSILMSKKVLEVLQSMPISLDGSLVEQTFNQSHQYAGHVDFGGDVTKQ